MEPAQVQCCRGGNQGVQAQEREKEKGNSGSRTDAKDEGSESWKHIKGAGLWFTMLFLAKGSTSVTHFDEGTGVSVDQNRQRT